MIVAGLMTYLSLNAMLTDEKFRFKSVRSTIYYVLFLFERVKKEPFNLNIMRLCLSSIYTHYQPPALKKMYTIWLYRYCKQALGCKERYMQRVRIQHCSSLVPPPTLLSPSQKVHLGTYVSTFNVFSQDKVYVKHSKCLT